MDHAQHNQIVNFIWNVADDVLRDVYVRGKAVWLEPRVLLK
jgi:type I restriction enzyme M protein